MSTIWHRKNFIRRDLCKSCLLQPAGNGMWKSQWNRQSKSKYRGSEELTMLSKSFAGSGQGGYGKEAASASGSKLGVPDMRYEQ